MTGTPRPAVVDNMVLAMFVDADRVPLLSALAEGGIYVPPSILDPSESPPFSHPPIAEFAKGLFSAQQDLANPLLANRANRRTAYYRAGTWQPVTLAQQELQLASHFASPAARVAARAANPTFRAKRVDAGEAECAAVAVARNWTLWTDDGGIIALLNTLQPQVNIERIADLLIRAVQQGLLPCIEAAALYNATFKGTLGLWSKISLDCQQGLLIER